VSAETGAPVHANTLSLAEAAQWYAALGCKVFPLPPRGKAAKLPGWQDKATTDPAQIRAWWTAEPLANVGVLNGGPFDVVDLDGADAVVAVRERFGGQVPPALGWVQTPRGWHAWIPAQGQRRRVGVLPHVDYLGTGGYVVAAPSVVDRTDETTGETVTAAYLWTEPPDLTPETPPDCSGWLALLDTEATVQNRTDTPRPGPSLSLDGSTPYGARALAAEAERVAAAAEGERNQTLNRAAFRVGQLVPHEIAESDARAALADAARTCGLPQGEALATIESGLASGKASPRTVDHGLRVGPNPLAVRHSQSRVEGGRWPSEPPDDDGPPDDWGPPDGPTDDAARAVSSW
jgi:Bifunctional DNA primase/polymerase, N-terminal